MAKNLTKTPAKRTIKTVVTTQTVNVIKTVGVTDVMNVTRDIGDILANKIDPNNVDLKIAETCLDAYKTTISASKAQLIYKKLTGNPGVIDFLEK